MDIRLSVEFIYIGDGNITDELFYFNRQLNVDTSVASGNQIRVIRLTIKRIATHYCQRTV